MSYSSSTTKQTNTKQKVRLAKFSMTQLIRHYGISQREDAETSPPSCCLVPFGSLSKCPSALCSSSKNRGWLLCTGAVCENVLLAFSLPGLVISALQTLSIPWTLLCQLFFIIVKELEDNSGMLFIGTLFLPQNTEQAFFLSHPTINDFMLQNSLEGISRWVCNYSAPQNVLVFSNVSIFYKELAHMGGGIKNQEAKNVVCSLWTLQ